MIEDNSTIGVENILFESDYPHGDGTRPDTQAVIHNVLGDLRLEEIHAITHANASKLYQHPLPEVIVP
jgi:predicted TIM-barrel fold metal-dependent hydrolase